MENDQNILTPQQARDLFAFLEGPEGCDFQRRSFSGPSITDWTIPWTWTWTCNGTLRMTSAWLSRHGLPVERTLTWLEQRGAYCDCEVLFNVASSMRGTGEEDGQPDD